MFRYCAAALCATLAITGRPRAAGADEPEPTAMEMSADVASVGGRAGSVRGMAKDWMISPAGVYTITGTVSYMMADAGLTNPDATSPDDMGEVKFTDIVLLGIGGRYSIKGKAEVAIGGVLLPKQPSYRDELFWQSANIGARIGFGKRYAGWGEVSAGPMLDRVGFWGSANLGVEARKSIHETIVFQGSLGAGGTSLMFDDDPQESFWLAEMAVDGEVVFREPHGNVAGWIGTQFRVPVAYNPDEPDPAIGLSIDPQTRVNFYLGAVLSFMENWDLFVKLVYVDRGDVEDPATTLPILNGGFDQTHLLFGLTRRFKSDPDNKRNNVIAY